MTFNIGITLVVLGLVLLAVTSILALRNMKSMFRNTLSKQPIQAMEQGFSTHFKFVILGIFGGLTLALGIVLAVASKVS